MDVSSGVPEKNGPRAERTDPAATGRAVAEVLGATLGLDHRRLGAGTPLFGSLPELDSMAVVEIVVALEERFGVVFEEDDVTSEAFATVASLAMLVIAKQS